MSVIFHVHRVRLGKVRAQLFKTRPVVVVCRSFAKMSSIQFAINGDVVALANPDPSVTLNDYIRHNTPFKGTKLGCGEGGCGACAVMVSSVDASGKEVHRSINSCLRPLVACDGLAVTTTEGLGSKSKGLHSVQKRIADFNGSQCGFCTPGMVMSAYAGLLRVAGETKAGDVDPKELGLLMEESFDGNICRCTGYRPILEAARSLVDDAVRDQVGSGCKTGAVTPAEAGAVAAAPPAIPEALHSASGAKEFHGPTLHWYRPQTVQAALELLETHGASARFAVANTSVGIYKNEPETVLVDLGSIPELAQVSQGGNSLVVGAAVTIANLIDALRARANERFEDGSRQRASSDALIRHCDRIANHHVRNAGTVGGNLALTAKFGFESDLATILCGYGATVSTVAIGGAEATTTSLLEYLQQPAEAARRVLVQSVEIPDPGGDTVFRSFKVGLRQLNSHALVNAAMRADIASDGTLSNVVAVYGAVHPEHPVLGAGVASAMNGKAVGDQTAAEAALAAVATEVVVPPASHRAAYRSTLVTSFLHKFLEILRSQGSDGEKPTGWERRFDADGTESRDLVQTRRALVATTGNSNGTEGSRHTQNVNSSAEEQARNQPVNAPVPKISARLQASGEARYTDDEPLPADSVFAAYATSTLANAKLLNVVTKEAEAAPGVIRVLTHKDIPGTNNIGGWWEEELMVSDVTAYAGQPIALVVADTLRHAQDAAKLVRGEYEQVEPPVLTNADSLAKGMAYNKIMNHHVRSSGKSIDEALAAAPLKLEGIKLHSQSQQHFYMEPQCAWANPDEGGRMRIGSSMQWPNGTQAQVSKLLGVQRNKVRVTNRRTGGGFGGKLTRHIPTSTGAALAAHVVGRPVRMTQPRDVDMMMTGGRHATDTTFSVG